VVTLGVPCIRQVRHELLGSIVPVDRGGLADGARRRAQRIAPPAPSCAASVDLRLTGGQGRRTSPASPACGDPGKRPMRTSRGRAGNGGPRCHSIGSGCIGTSPRAPRRGIAATCAGAVHGGSRPAVTPDGCRWSCSAASLPGREPGRPAGIGFAHGTRPSDGQRRPGPSTSRWPVARPRATATGPTAP